MRPVSRRNWRRRRPGIGRFRRLKDIFAGAKERKKQTHNRHERERDPMVTRPSMWFPSSQIEKKAGASHCERVNPISWEYCAHVFWERKKNGRPSRQFADNALIGPSLISTATTSSAKHHFGSQPPPPTSRLWYGLTFPMYFYLHLSGLCFNPFTYLRLSYHHHLRLPAFTTLFLSCFDLAAIYINRCLFFSLYGGTG